MMSSFDNEMIVKNKHHHKDFYNPIDDEIIEDDTLEKLEF